MASPEEVCILDYRHKQSPKYAGEILLCSDFMNPKYQQTGILKSPDLDIRADDASQSEVPGRDQPDSPPQVQIVKFESQRSHRSMERVSVALAMKKNLAKMPILKPITHYQTTIVLWFECGNDCAAYFVCPMLKAMAGGGVTQGFAQLERKQLLSRCAVLAPRFQMQFDLHCPRTRNELPMPTTSRIAH